MTVDANHLAHHIQSYLDLMEANPPEDMRQAFTAFAMTVSSPLQSTWQGIYDALDDNTILTFDVLKQMLKDFVAAHFDSDARYSAISSLRNARKPRMSDNGRELLLPHD